MFDNTVAYRYQVLGRGRLEELGNGSVGRIREQIFDDLAPERP
jgi:hypothetical protein